MKTTWMFVAALATGMGFAGAVSAQGVPSASTKVAVINIGTVFSKYEKANQMKKEMQDLLKPIQMEADKLKKDILDWTKALETVKEPMLRSQYENGIVYNKRKLEDLSREAQKKVGKRQEEQLVQLYKDVHTAIGVYSQASGFHLVLGYGDPPDLDPFSFMGITRKLQVMDGGGLTPLWWMPGSNLDISAGVVTMLNQSIAGGGGNPTLAPKTN